MTYLETLESTKSGIMSLLVSVEALKVDESISTLPRQVKNSLTSINALINTEKKKGACHCSESMGLYVHDCVYIARRNKFIPMAYDNASLHAERGKNGYVWSRIFMHEMDKLYKKP